MHILRLLQHERGLPPLDRPDGKVLVSNGREVRIVDGTKMNLSRTLEARSVIYVVDLGAAARQVRHRIERLEQKSGLHKGKRAHASAA